MTRKKTLDYNSAGVSIAANDEVVKRIGPLLRATHDRCVLPNHGGFAGLYDLGRGRRLRDPVLVSCADGVGSKVLLAGAARKLDTVGIDLVAMNVNDLITCGARPLFFLDYVAVHKNSPTATAAIVRGVCRGCKQAGCALLGGETAEMPDIYRKNEFDLAGFAVGVVERKHLVNGTTIRPGDSILGLRSSGIHSNGYSLVRKAFSRGHSPLRMSARITGLNGTLGQHLLKPTRIYSKAVVALLERHPRIIKGMAHITGGGLPGNVPRILPTKCRACIDTTAWRPHAIFRALQDRGIAEKEMYDVFNMGIGMTLVVRRKDVMTVQQHFKKQRLACHEIGRIESGRRGVDLLCR